jgi:hypothetical protein
MNYFKKIFWQALDSDWLVRWSWFLVISFCLLFWLGVYAALATPTPDHRGGSVQAYLDHLKGARPNMRLDGEYHSAATLFLAIEGACVTPNSVFYFHGPGARTKGLGLPLEEFERVSRQMADQYAKASPQLAEWFMTVARYRSGPNFYRVTGAKLINIGVKQCN